jgi:hypothetical protein
MMHCTPHSRGAGHGPGCGCVAGLGRRGLLGGLGAALSLAAAPRAVAGSDRYEAMLVNCIDPRLTSHCHGHMAGKGLRDLYSHFVIAGGPLGAVHPRFTAWHAAFWDNLDITVSLHRIPTLVALTHRDCGAAKLALGESAVAGPAAETASHAEVLRAFRAEVGRRKPGLRVVTGIMALDGTVQEIT